MAKTRISSTDLAWIFQEKLSAFDSCPPTVSIAIVPSGEDGWAAVTSARTRGGLPSLRKAHPADSFAFSFQLLFLASATRRSGLLLS